MTMPRGGKGADEMYQSGLRGKVALVTGGGSGIGRAVAERLAAAGVSLAVCDLVLERAEEVVRAIPGGALSMQVDVTSAASVSAALAAVDERFGQLDILVNNAGVVTPGAVEETSETDWDSQIDVNLKGAFLVSKEAWRLLSLSSSSCVVNVASIAGITTSRRRAAYSASKAGLIMLTKCMALDWAAEGIRVNCVCPGWVDTPMVQAVLDQEPDPEAARRQAANLHPLGRMGRADDIAYAIVYLSSEHAEWVTGTVLVVDGGLTLN